jgi:multimeric flavodoxin WrbA
LRAVVLDGTEKENPVENALRRVFAGNEEELSYFKLKNMRIHPCRSCGACGLKSPGRCVINDEMHGVMRAIAKSSLYIMLSPVRFGGYSSHLKKAVDRTMSLGMPFYIVKGGHLLHPMRYGDKALLGIGLLENDVSGQEDNFKMLVARNALNMQSSYYKALIIKPGDDAGTVEHALSNVFNEVSRR